MPEEFVFRVLHEVVVNEPLSSWLEFCDPFPERDRILCKRAMGLPPLTAGVVPVRSCVPFRPKQEFIGRSSYGVQPVRSDLRTQREEAVARLQWDSTIALPSIVLVVPVLAIPAGWQSNSQCSPHGRSDMPHQPVENSCFVTLPVTIRIGCGIVRASHVAVVVEVSAPVACLATECGGSDSADPIDPISCSLLVDPDRHIVAIQNDYSSIVRQRIAICQVAPSHFVRRKPHLPVNVSHQQSETIDLRIDDTGTCLCDAPR